MRDQVDYLKVQVLKTFSKEGKEEDEIYFFVGIQWRDNYKDLGNGKRFGRYIEIHLKKWIKVNNNDVGK